MSNQGGLSEFNDGRAGNQESEKGCFFRLFEGKSLYSPTFSPGRKARALEGSKVGQGVQLLLGVLKEKHMSKEVVYEFSARSVSELREVGEFLGPLGYIILS